MHKDHSSLPVEDASTTIFRYMDFVSFYSLLVNQSLFFKRLDKYTDVLEGQLFDETVNEYFEFRKNIDPYASDEEAKTWTNNEAENIKLYKAWTLSNSWNIAEDENYAMWKIYLRGYTEGVAIRTTVGKLKEQLDNNKDFEFYSGRVKYGAVPKNDVSQFTISTNKRQPYAYENEYRAIVLHQFVPDNDRRHAKWTVGAEVKVDVNELVDLIYVSPFSTPWFLNLLKIALSDHLPGFDHDHIVYSKIQDS
jgi:hypothetical protein